MGCKTDGGGCVTGFLVLITVKYGIWRAPDKGPRSIVHVTEFRSREIYPATSAS